MQRSDREKRVKPMTEKRVNLDVVNKPAERLFSAFQPV
jgi:hypothetical protein